MNIACALSTDAFKSRLIEAIGTGAIVVAPPRTDDGCAGEAEERKAKRLLVMDVKGRRRRGRPKDC